MFCIFYVSFLAISIIGMMITDGKDWLGDENFEKVGLSIFGLHILILFVFGLYNISKSF